MHGPVTLTFDLHNRHTYSEEQIKDEPRVRPLHRGHWRPDDGQHAREPGGDRRASSEERLISVESQSAVAPARAA